MPGGESTTMSKLLESPTPCSTRSPTALERRTAGVRHLRRHDPARARRCSTAGPTSGRFGAIDIDVRRNAYGRQVDSFETDLDVEGLDSPFHAVFIRAPRVERVGPGSRCWPRSTMLRCSVPVGIGVWVAAFHPELTDDLRVHNCAVHRGS